MGKIREFKTIEEAKEYGKDFSKHQHELVLVDGKKKILCGTDLAFEDEIWGNMYDTLQFLYKNFISSELIEEKDEDECLLTDKTSSLRDDILRWFEETMDVEFVIVYDEY